MLWTTTIWFSVRFKIIAIFSRIRDQSDTVIRNDGAGHRISEGNSIVRVQNRFSITEEAIDVISFGEPAWCDG